MIKLPATPSLCMLVILWRTYIHVMKILPLLGLYSQNGRENHVACYVREQVLKRSNTIQKTHLANATWNNDWKLYVPIINYSDYTFIANSQVKQSSYTAKSHRTMAVMKYVRIFQSRVGGLAMDCALFSRLKYIISNSFLHKTTLPVIAIPTKKLLLPSMFSFYFVIKWHRI